MYTSTVNSFKNSFKKPSTSNKSASVTVVSLTRSLKASTNTTTVSVSQTRKRDNRYSSPDKRQQLAIEKMSNSVDAILASKPAQVAFEKRRGGVSSF